ncbi:uncharacterized protein [Hetaerina americana]|uniref:uncharacterized protein n=1 Tax=Hetaerina americana TaxID=62018 RepID=UPI003A7F5496
MKGGAELGFPPLSFLGPGKEENGPSRSLGSSRSSTSTALYENLPLRTEENAYDELPRRSPRCVASLPVGGCLLPTAARLLLMASPNCRQEEGESSRPNIPSPDYGSDLCGSEDSNSSVKAEEGDGLAEDEEDLVPDDDSVRDQGLEVILEESEEERGSGDLNQAPYISAAAPLHDYGSLLSDFGRKSGQDKDLVTPDFTDSLSVYQNKHSEELNKKDSWRGRSLLFNNMGRDLTKENGKEVDKKMAPNGTLPSVKGLRNHFESLPCVTQVNSTSPPIVPWSKEWMGGQKSSDGNLSRTKIEKIENSPPRKINTNHSISDVRKKPSMLNLKDDSEEYVMRLRKCTLHWNPESLMDKLYNLKKAAEKEFNSHRYINISGTLDKLPSGRKKATFWNAWKSRYFKAENGFLSVYQKSSSETPLMTMQLMGGKVEVLKPIGMDENMMRNCTLLGIDDGKGHYVVVKCPNEIESNAWLTALQTQVVENYESMYVEPLALIRGPSCTKDTLIIDLGSCSLRAGVLTTQPSLPQIFFPSVMAVHKESSERWFGFDAVSPDVRSESKMFFPIRPSAKITKYSVDLDGCYGLIEKVFKMLAIQPDGYNIFLSVPRSFNSHTLSNIVNTMFQKWRVKSLSISHQSVLTLYAYNARSGIVVDIGERTDVIPISEGYILERGVTRTPYGSHQVIEMLKQLLNEKNHSFATDVETYLVRYIVENLCYCAQDYSSEHKEALKDLHKVKKEISIKDVYCDANVNVDSISLDIGRFQAPEGLFNPDIWGHDNIGVHKMVHKGIQECSMDIRKEMIRSIYLSGGVTMVPGFASRLLLEVDKLTPPSITPKVHASPYRYHAAYIGASVLANSEQVSELTVKRQEWIKSGYEVLSKWNI